MGGSVALNGLQALKIGLRGEYNESIPFNCIPRPRKRLCFGLHGLTGSVQRYIPFRGLSFPVRSMGTRVKMMLICTVIPKQALFKIFKNFKNFRAPQSLCLCGFPEVYDNVSLLT